MIYIKVMVKGEPDVRPIYRIFQYEDETDELILHHSAEMVREKLGKNMKLNVNEVLLLYAYCVASLIRGKKCVDVIENKVRAMLSVHQILVGVAESLRTITFDAVVDGRREWLVLREPIPSSRYIMAAE